MEIQVDDAPEIDVATVGPGYFETMGVRLLRGRDFEESDRESATRVAIVSAAAANRYWPGADPIGKRFRFDDADGRLLEVIGLAADTKVRTLGERPRPYLYVPFLQEYEPAMSLVARTAGDPSATVATLRREVEALDPMNALRRE